MEMLAAMTMYAGGFCLLLIAGEVLYSMLTLILDKLEAKERKDNNE